MSCWEALVQLKLYQSTETLSRKGRLSKLPAWAWWRAGREVMANSITLKGLQSSVTEKRVKVPAESRALHTLARMGGWYKRSHYSKRSMWNHIWSLAKSIIVTQLECGKLFCSHDESRMEPFRQYFQTPFLQLRMVMIRSCCFLLAGNRHLVQIKRRMDGTNELLQSAEKLEPERKSFAVMNTRPDMKDKYPAF